MSPSRFLATLVASALLALSTAAPAQSVPPPNTPPPAGVSQSAAAPMSQDLLDSLLAPIALYPDELLSQVLMASTYPLDVVEAARFVKANPNLKGPALDDALKDKTWDASVLSLTSFPQVLDMMSEKLDWTQRLGDAFLANEAAVMQTVQGLRMRAQQAGNLQSTPQQQVVFQDRTIIIQPAQPQVLYVPVYNPTVIFGPWWAPAYRPWYWYPAPIWGYPPRPYNWGYATGFFWGASWGLTRNNWGWAQPNWHGNNINININNNNVWVNRPGYRNQYQNNGNWQHNVDNRRGVAYRDASTANRYRPSNGSGSQSRENYRNRDNTTRPGGTDRPNTGNVTRPGGTDRPNTDNVTRPGGTGRPDTGNTARPGGTGRPDTGNVNRPPPNMSRPANTGTRPAFQPESRPQVQRDANRGAQSRASVPQQRTTTPQQRPMTPQQAAPSANRGNSGGGGGGGGGQGRGR
jgi:Protein of unknown function (DUF3300)